MTFFKNRNMINRSLVAKHPAGNITYSGRNQLQYSELYIYV